ncbi:MAG TPA: short-chain dehydrogenase [Planktothrix sp. UBA8407]|jgi:Dehydrogenases with different specificities (related to short-chain alcohol dehydrogenases)|nr:short-chain dehydrogenase [Planktothrix sp. UBA8402]HAO13788.1 short-chain dehydrogenase [Planktothrix sp. UBA8407]HBK22678.1 short-chain dehydrogenase [Planktothrix sp. UBA10369]
MDLGLKNKVALVTGSSAGIGFTIAEKLAEEGCNLIICGRNSQQLQEAYQSLIQAYPLQQVLSLSADVHQAEDSERLVQESLKKYGRIDILVNNSEGANFTENLIENLSDEDWLTVFQGKLMGYIRLTNLVLPRMKQQQWGRIINIIGTSGKEPSPRLVKSGVVNAALMNFTKSVARQSAASGVLINSINPGIIDTPRHREYLQVYAEKEGTTPDLIRQEIIKSIPMNRIGRSEELANLAVFLASECASYMTGITIPVDGGISASAF